MAARGMIITPSCEVTGLPLPVLPTIQGNEDFHHHFHPRNAPELSYTLLGGHALRIARGQDLNTMLHNRYHNIFAGPVLPNSVDDRFRLCVLAIAGALPRQAIKITGKREFEVVEVTDDLFTVLAPTIHREPKNTPIMQLMKRRTIGEFFGAYALQQDIAAAVSMKVIHEFLASSTSAERKVELGNLILSEASVAAAEPLDPYYQALKDGGYLATDSVARLSKKIRHFFQKDQYPSFYQAMTEALQPVA